MVLQIKTEKELIEMVQALKNEIDCLKAVNKSNEKKFYLMFEKINEKPTVIKQTIIKEIEKPTVIKETVVKTDASVLPTLKKISDRLKTLENKKLEKPIVNNITTGVEINDVLELINKHVTMIYVNKLYKKGK